MSKSLKYYENIALTNFDILKLLNGKANIVLYPDLYRYGTIDQLLGQYEACILLFEARPNYGHWVCIFKLNDNTLEFFNPYGGFPDDSLRLISTKFKKKSHQDKPYLSLLMLQSSYELTYNEFQFQSRKGDIKTCGRHCVVRILNRDKSLYEYHTLLNQLCKKYNTDYDGVVTLLTIKGN
jgi:hypothetical protein